MTSKPAHEFPCRFPIKILAKSGADLAELVKKTLENELQDSTEIEFDSRQSSQGKYHSITATFTANSQDELDRIYQKLSKNQEVLWMI